MAAEKVEGDGLRGRLRRGWRVSRWLAVETVRSALSKDLSLLAAGLAFFALISAAPFLVIAVALGGAVFGAEAAREEIYLRLSAEIGPEVAELFLNMVAGARSIPSLSIATFVSLILLLWSSSRLLAEVRRALHLLWDIPLATRPGFHRAALRFLRERLLAAAGVLAFGVVFIVLLGSRVALHTASDLIGLVDFLDLPWFVWTALEEIVSLAVVTLGVLLIYRFLPAQRPVGRGLFLGALATGVLLSAGRLFITIYLSTGIASSAYGAAGSLIIFLVWAHYSAMGFLLGARLTHLIDTRAFREAHARGDDDEAVDDEAEPVALVLEVPEPSDPELDDPTSLRREGDGDDEGTPAPPRD